MSLRSRVPELLCELMERGVTVTVNMSRWGDELDLHWTYKDIGSHVHIPYEIGVYGANTIKLERHLVLLLEKVIIGELNGKSK